MEPRGRQSEAQQASSRPRHDKNERIDEKRPVGAEQAEVEPAKKKKKKKKRKKRSAVGIATAIAALIVSAVSAYISIISYQSQQNASNEAMADQVVLVAPPMSLTQLDQLKRQHPLDFYKYFPMHVQNYGRLPVLGLIVWARVNGKIEASQAIGTLLPCAQVEVDGVLRSAMSRGQGQGKWSVIVSFEDVSGQTWERSLAGKPWRVDGPHFALQEGVGIATSRVNDCTAA